MSPKRNTLHRSRFRLALTAATLLFFLAYRLYLIPARSLPEMLMGWVIEVIVFATILLVGILFERPKVIGRFVFHGTFLPAFLLHFAFFFFFAEATWRRYSLLDSDPAQLLYFFTDVLPLTGWALLLVSLIVLYGSARLIPTPSRPIMAAAFLLLAGGIGVGLSAASADSPVAYIKTDLEEALRAHSLSASAEKVPVEWNTWNRAEPDKLRYKKIVVFVMESVTTKALAEGSKALPPQSLFAKMRRQAHAYNHLIASNMDSRTGMLSMLSARFIPFEAYDEVDVEQYAFLAKERSLVQRMNDYGYRTAYSASETEHEEVVYDLPWSERLVMTEADRTAAAKKGFLCMVPYEFEHSCDDRVLLPTLVDFVAKNDKAFLYYEFLYGHSQEYMDAMKIDPVRYYSDYIEQFTNDLKARDLLQETLIVIVSDHGIRMKGFETELSTYTLPLLFLNPSFSERNDDRLFAHFDFKDILLAEASHTSAPEGRQYAPFVGMTSSAIVGAADAKGGLTVIKNRRWRPYAQKASQAVDAEQLLGRIRSYREQFQELCTGH